MGQERCATIQEALESIDSVVQLDGFTAALKNPDLKTKAVSEVEWVEIAHLKIKLRKGQ